MTSVNVDQMRQPNSGPEIKRLLGVGDDLGQKLGLSADWAYNIIKQVGNYGEIFERNIGGGTPLQLQRGLNALWTHGRPFASAAVPLGARCVSTWYPQLSAVTARPLAPCLCGHHAWRESRLGAPAYRPIGRCRPHRRVVHNVATNLTPSESRQASGFHRARGFRHFADANSVQRRFQSYFTVFVVALLNTLLVSLLSIVFGTFLGFVVALSRSSSNGSVAATGSVYVETFRNIPLLIQLLFWYFAVVQALPAPGASFHIASLIFLNNRGLFIPSIQFGDLLGLRLAPLPPVSPYGRSR